MPIEALSIKRKSSTLQALHVKTARSMQACIAALAMLLLCLDANCAEAEVSSVELILLYAGATVELKRPDRCDVVTNVTSATTVSLPLADQTWQHFVDAGYHAVEIKDCLKR